MAELRSNPLLKWVVMPVVVLAVVIGVSLMNAKKGSRPADADSPQLTPEQAKALGIEGDTPSDTLRTIVAESKQLKDRMDRILGDNAVTKAENERLKEKLNNLDQNVEQKIQHGLEALEQQSQEKTQGLLDAFQGQLDNLSKLGNAGGSAGSDIPIGLGINPGEGQQFKAAGDQAELIWIDPQDGVPLDANGKPLASDSPQAATGFAFPTSFGSAGQKALDAASSSASRVADGLGNDPQGHKRVRKVYTLPQNSTLMGSVSMTALIGRVPVDGTVNDPYPFKVLIGPDNLTANGIDLPNVTGAVASGTASGDWTLSCVRGQIRSLTFIFNDGRVRTLPAPQEAGQGGGNTNQNASSGGQPSPIQGGMGWISDPYGIPCISGERKSNAAQYIGSQALITAAGAGAASLIKSESSNTAYVATSNGTIGTTGISGNEAMGRILGQGVNDISSWVNKLYGQAFAAVYVQPGAKVAIHLDQELAIDYELNGRKVDYRTGASHATAELD